MKPRSGLLRGREFLMKDMYSFDSSQEAAFQSYEAVKKAYIHIFNKLQIDYVIAEAESGSIGGDKSHEFHIVSDVGEDSILICSSCKAAANTEKAIAILPNSSPNVSLSCTAILSNLEQIMTHPSISIYKYNLIKENKHEANVHVILSTKNQPNPFKVKSLLKMDDIEEQTLEKQNNSNLPLFVCADESILHENLNLIQKESHQIDPKNFFLGDFRIAQTGDLCRSCHKPLEIKYGIEVGHIFYLGTRYSKPLGAVIHTSDSKNEIIEMGCYGIGVSRVLASVIEVLSDEKGIVWPLAIAPYKIIIIPITAKNDKSIMPVYFFFYILFEKLIKNLEY